MLRNLLILTVLFGTTNSIAEISEVSSGQAIEASKINEIIRKVNELERKILPVGSILHSLLTLEQFQSENGDCWRKLDGAPLAASDELKSFGYNFIPNAESRFLRNTGPSSASLGLTQEDSFKEHNHIGGFPRASGYAYGDNSMYGTIVSGTGYVSTQANGTYTRRYAYTSTTGGTETRPKNLTVNFFVKVKKTCNFN